MTGLGVRLGAIILDRIRVGPVATIAKVNNNKIGLKLPAASPTKVANKPVGEYKNLCTFYDHNFHCKQNFQEFYQN
ncbi:hypothetical protein NSIN_20350 [Nitrosotalea sinensis]|uniref:Uncharacterized protein n=1 Tax=Nitrosotalea sinensis TaxID=1499975 RepID=A0A2H1EG31_9ARCH|nr:hypothetical protein NSIN_20350 [Candidatus Nitrosotalea sinensis]